MAKQRDDGVGTWGIPVYDVGAFDAPEALPVAPRSEWATGAMVRPSSDTGMWGPQSSAGEVPAAPVAGPGFGMVEIRPPGGGRMWVPDMNVVPGATWREGDGGKGAAVDYRLQADPGPQRPPAPPVWNAAPGAPGAAPQAFTNYAGNVYSQRAEGPVAAPGAGMGAPAALTPETPVVSALEAQQRRSTMARREIEGGMGSGGATSVRERAIAGEMAGRRDRAAGNVDADRAAARQRGMPQASVAGGLAATWNGTTGQWDVSAQPVAGPQPEKMDLNRVDPVTGMRISDLWKEYFKNEDGDKQNPFYTYDLRNAKTPEEIKAVEARYGVNKGTAAFFAARLKENGIDVATYMGYGGAPGAPQVPSPQAQPANRGVIGRMADGVDRLIKGTPKPPAGATGAAEAGAPAPVEAGAAGPGNKWRRNAGQ